MIEIRNENADDAGTIRSIITAAFAAAEHSSGSEAAIVDALRDAGALTISLVAVDNQEIVGHVALSPVSIDAKPGGWFGLGPVSVRPDRQGNGVGKALVESGLAELRAKGADGCVVLGDPRYYSRFGFASDPKLRYADAPVEYFQRVIFKGPLPVGQVAYHASFDLG